MTNPILTVLSIQYLNHDFYILNIVHKAGHAETVKWLRRFNLTIGKRYKKKIQNPILTVMS